MYDGMKDLPGAFLEDFKAAAEANGDKLNTVLRQTMES